MIRFRLKPLTCERNGALFKNNYVLLKMNTEDLIIKHLKEGKTQYEVAEIFKNEGIVPNSLSSIEKSLKAIREKHGAKTMFHLGVILSNKTNNNK